MSSASKYINTQVRCIRTKWYNEQQGITLVCCQDYKFWQRNVLYFPLKGKHKTGVLLEVTNICWKTITNITEEDYELVEI